MGGPTELKGPGLVRDGIAAADLADGATVAGRALGKEVLLVHRGTRQRVELWVHARRQGQVAAQNIFGRRRAFTHLPSFWSAHYDLSISYAGRPGYASAGCAADFIVVEMFAEAATGKETPKAAMERAEKRALRYYKV